MNKRGLSTVVTTVIMIVLVLVAVGVVWAVIKNLLGSQEEQINLSQRCVATQIEIESASCTGSDCTVVVKKTGGYDIDGIMVAAIDGTDSDSHDESGNIELIKTVNWDTGVDLSNANKATAAAYFTDTDGNTVTCTQVAEFEIPS